MTKWPTDFASMLNEEGLRLLEGPQQLPEFRLDNRLTPYRAYPSILRDEVRRDGLSILENGAWPVIKHSRHTREFKAADANNPSLDYESSPFSACHYFLYGSFARMDGIDKPEKEIGADAGPWRASDDEFRSVFVDTGLAAMCRSESLLRFAQNISGCELSLNKHSGIILLCYGAGDYIGPHTDVNWPGSAGWDTSGNPVAYVDVHMSFSTDSCALQYLVVQEGAFVNKVVGGQPVNGNVGVYRIPFWHYSTPLMAKAGHEADARRWIVMVNFEILGDNRSKVLCD